MAAEALNKKGGPFTDDDEKRLEAFVEKQRIEDNLRVAHDIQMAMLPGNFPARREFELVTRHSSWR